jgi:hypothetical protein
MLTLGWLQRVAYPNSHEHQLLGGLKGSGAKGKVSQSCTEKFLQPRAFVSAALAA